MKAQIGIETMIVMTVLIVLLVFSIISYINRSSEINSMKEYLKAKKLCQILQTSISQISSNSYGSALQLNMPDKIENSNYSVDIYASDRKIIVSWKNFSISCLFTIQNVTNTSGMLFSKFTVGKGNNSVSMDGDGTVVIKKI